MVKCIKPIREMRIILWSYIYIYIYMWDYFTVIVYTFKRDQKNCG